MTKTTTIETRKLQVSQNIIHSLIKNQAGTLAKAVLECIMNSIDAGASKVDVQVTNKSLRVVDDGVGFSKKDDILSCFEVFGFEHDKDDRTYGQFGIGRAQLWNFCTTAWRTRTFKMDVDIKNKGLDYNLEEGLPDSSGLSIEGSFYKPLKTSEIYAFEAELSELALYAQVPVTVNGKLISKNPANEKWTHETKEAWIHIRESGNLRVYNLGVFVREYPAHIVGCGGKVVTKPGVKLALNMARNDIILTDCKVWKKIRPFLQNESDKRIKDKKRKMLRSEIDNIAMRFVAGEIAPSDVKSVQFITDINGKAYTIESFLRKASNKPIITGPKDSQVLDRVNQEGLALVLADETLERFGASTPKELGEKFNKMAKAGRFTHPSYKLYGLKFEDDATKVTSLLKNDFNIIDRKFLTEEEKAILDALNDHATRHVCAALNRHGQRVNYRNLAVGTSDIADAWTDGKYNIVYNRSVLKIARKGLPGMQVLVNLMLHEYLHDFDTAGSHKHDDWFYSTYHDITTNSKWGEGIGQGAQYAFRHMMTTFHEKGIKMIKAFKDGVDDLDSSPELSISANSSSDTAKIDVVAKTTVPPSNEQVLVQKRPRGRPRKIVQS